LRSALFKAPLNNSVPALDRQRILDHEAGLPLKPATEKICDTELEFSGAPRMARAAGLHNVVGDVEKGWPFPAITALF
jgi:hypothetical protein